MNSQRTGRRTTKNSRKTAASADADPASDAVEAIAKTKTNTTKTNAATPSNKSGRSTGTGTGGRGQTFRRSLRTPKKVVSSGSEGGLGRRKRSVNTEDENGNNKRMTRSKSRSKNRASEPPSNDAAVDTGTDVIAADADAKKVSVPDERKKQQPGLDTADTPVSTPKVQKQSRRADGVKKTSAGAADVGGADEVSAAELVAVATDDAKMAHAEEAVLPIGGGGNGGNDGNDGNGEDETKKDEDIQKEGGANAKKPNNLDSNVKVTTEDIHKEDGANTEKPNDLDSNVKVTTEDIHKKDGANTEKPNDLDSNAKMTIEEGATAANNINNKYAFGIISTGTKTGGDESDESVAPAGMDSDCGKAKMIEDVNVDFSADIGSTSIGEGGNDSNGRGRFQKEEEEEEPKDTHTTKIGRTASFDGGNGEDEAKKDGGTDSKPTDLVISAKMTTTDKPTDEEEIKKLPAWANNTSTVDSSSGTTIGGGNGGNGKDEFHKEEGGEEEEEEEVAANTKPGEQNIPKSNDGTEAKRDNAKIINGTLVDPTSPKKKGGMMANTKGVDFSDACDEEQQFQSPDSDSDSFKTAVIDDNNMTTIGSGGNDGNKEKKEEDGGGGTGRKPTDLVVSATMIADEKLIYDEVGSVEAAATKVATKVARVRVEDDTAEDGKESPPFNAQSSPFLGGGDRDRRHSAAIIAEDAPINKSGGGKYGLESAWGRAVNFDEVISSGNANDGANVITGIENDGISAHQLQGPSIASSASFGTVARTIFHGEEKSGDETRGREEKHSTSTNTTTISHDEVESVKAAAAEKVVTSNDEDEEMLEGAKAEAEAMCFEDATDDEGGNEDRPFDIQYSHALGENGLGLRPTASLFMQQEGSTETEESNVTNTGGALMIGLDSANYGLMRAGNNQICLETMTDQVGGRDCALSIGQSHFDRSNEGTAMPEVAPAPAAGHEIISDDDEGQKSRFDVIEQTLRNMRSNVTTEEVVKQSEKRTESLMNRKESKEESMKKSFFAWFPVPEKNFYAFLIAFSHSVSTNVMFKDYTCFAFLLSLSFLAGLLAEFWLSWCSFFYFVLIEIIVRIFTK